MTNNKPQFIGREQELANLDLLLDKKTASLVVIYGRRRIGKSRLIHEFSHCFKHAYFFTGLHPRAGLTNQTQLNEFSLQAARQFTCEKSSYNDWSDAFFDVNSKTQDGKTLIVFDEITWLGLHDADFLGKLKIAWDMYFNKNPNLIVVLCGSVSAWINQHLLSSTGFHGRISLKIRLNELSLQSCGKFWGNQSSFLSSYEKLKLFAVTGGVPKYLEEILPHLSANENIKRLCFMESGLLYNDFSQIFTDTLQKNSPLYLGIVSLLANQSLSQKELAEKLQVANGGGFTQYCEELRLAGFISYHKTWNLANGKISRLGKYRLSDNYLRFYLKYIQPNAEKISADLFQYQDLASLPGWSTIISLQVENLVLNNRHEIIQRLGINSSEIQCDNPYFQQPTTKHPGCQIDYLIQTQFNNLYVCEIKFTRNIIRSDIIDEVRKKIAALAIPKHTSIRPVLIHMGDLHDTVYDAGYFAKIINLSDLV